MDWDWVKEFSGLAVFDTARATPRDWELLERALKCQPVGRPAQVRCVWPTHPDHVGEPAIWTVESNLLAALISSVTDA